MAQVEKTFDNEHPPRPAKSTLWRDAQAAIRIRDEKPMRFNPIKIDGERLSQTIIRERRGEF